MRWGTYSDALPPYNGNPEDAVFQSLMRWGTYSDNQQNDIDVEYERVSIAHALGNLFRQNSYQYNRYIGKIVSIAHALGNLFRLLSKANSQLIMTCFNRSCVGEPIPTAILGPSFFRRFSCFLLPFSCSSEPFFLICEGLVKVFKKPLFLISH